MPLGRALSKNITWGWLSCPQHLVWRVMRAQQRKSEEQGTMDANVHEEMTNYPVVLSERGRKSCQKCPFADPVEMNWIRNKIWKDILKLKLTHNLSPNAVYFLCGKTLLWLLIWKLNESNAKMKGGSGSVPWLLQLASARVLWEVQKPKPYLASLSVKVLSTTMEEVRCLASEFFPQKPLHILPIFVVQGSPS